MATKREAEPDQGEIDNRRLRSALEYAVAIAAETAKRKPPMESPTSLKTYFGVDRLPTSALGRVRRAVEDDETFRSRIAAGAIPELVDEVGRLWLQRPEGWRARVGDVLAAESSEERSEDLERALRKAEKRRLAAERATQRAIADLVASEAAANAARVESAASAARIDLLEVEISQLRAELTEARTEARHERDRKEATAAKLAAAREELAAMGTAAGGPGGAGTAAERDELERLRREAVERERTLAELEEAIVTAAATAGRLGEELRRLVGDAQLGDASGELGSRASRGARPGSRSGSPSDSAAATERSSRQPLKLPGGVRGASVEAAEVLLRSGAEVYVDGYNVTKLAWPGRALCDQRETLIVAAENAARRFGATLTIVFDGADVVGGFAPARRVVRIVYSPEGVTADDVIRSEVARIDPSVPVVVVTDDAEIVCDVKLAGANVISSGTFAELL